MRSKHRTREQIVKDDLLFSVCSICGEKLRASKQPRTSAKKCADCKGDGQSDNAEVKKLFKELQSKQIEVSEDEMSFDDCPIAVKEKDYSRYISKSISNGKRLDT